jgi:GNAT superfamily N-acetyltransferase
MWLNDPHPLLPEIDRVYDAAEINAFGKDRGPAFYEMAHRYAQSLWRLGYPAKCILLLNRALSSPMAGSEPIFQRLPLPYAALAWLLIHRPADQFIGNPRRHWQHLATRMVEPNKELRTWRAWACWYLAKEILPEAEFPGDLEQIRAEGIVEPTYDQIVEQLSRLSPANDLQIWQATLAQSRKRLRLAERLPMPVRIRRIAADELPMVKELANHIWFAHYPGIISEAQINYMLSIWYQPDAMAREMEVRDVWYALIEAEARGAVGYLSFEKQSEKGSVLFINKLYVLPEMHGRGIGAAALTWAEERARDLACHRVQLRVNKSNPIAIRAYQRAGFQFIDDVCTDIGSGFVMDDYLMEKAVTGVTSNS